MSPSDIGFIGIGCLLLLLFLGVHVGFCMVLVGFIGFIFAVGYTPALGNLAILPFERLTNYHYTVMPLFVLMSAYISQSGIGKDAYITARAWFGQFRGGLAMATVAASGLFAACAGTSMAGTLVMGKVAYPEMKKFGYDNKLACGVISAGGTLGLLIPPSMGFILIGILTELSIGKLFMAGIIPGLTEIIFYIGTIYIISRINPRLAPAAPRTTFREKVGSVKLTWSIMLLFILIMGGIYGGIFTPVEAAGVGALGALIIGFAKRGLNGPNFWAASLEAAKMTATMMAILIGAFVFNTFLAVTRIPFVISEFMVALSLPTIFILVIVLLFYIILGCFFDVYALLILTIPIIYPAMDALGLDLIWYSVLMVRIVEIGNITPPFGLNLFGMASVIDVPMSDIFRGVLPFIIADVVNLAVLVAFPVISTFLPGAMS